MGEKNDLYSSNVTIGGRRISTAFAFKGPATAPPLTIAKLGKNGDQIPRLFSTIAEAFFVQFEGDVEEAVKNEMLTHAIRKSHETGKEIFYGIIAGEDSHRLRVKLPERAIYREELLACAEIEATPDVSANFWNRMEPDPTIGMFSQLSEHCIEGRVNRPKESDDMRFRSKLLQPRKASEPTLMKIHDVYMTPDGRVEGEDQATTNALEGAKSILRQPEKTDNGLK